MKSNRHVPIITGIVLLSVSIYLAFWIGGFWAILGAAILTLFGWPSLKTGLFADSNEIDELTGVKDLSEETSEKFKNRL